MNTKHLDIRTSPFKAVVYEVFDRKKDNVLFVTISKVDAEKFITQHQNKTTESLRRGV